VPDWTNYDKEALPVVATENTWSAGGLQYFEIYFSSDNRVLKTKAILVGKIGDLVSGENIKIIPGGRAAV
jgi:hypothetical protein